MNIVDIKRADLELLVEFEKRCFDDNTAYDYSMLLQSYNESEGMAYKVLEDEKLVGYLMAAPVKDPRLKNAVDVDSIAVDPEYRGRGFAKALMLKAEKEAINRGFRLMVLEVREKNVEALGLYKKLGYTFYEHLPEFYTFHYGGSRHGIRMTKEL